MYDSENTGEPEDKEQPEHGHQKSKTPYLYIKGEVLLPKGLIVLVIGSSEQGYYCARTGRTLRRKQRT